MENFEKAKFQKNYGKFWKKTKFQKNYGKF